MFSKNYFETREIPDPTGDGEVATSSSHGVRQSMYGLPPSKAARARNVGNGITPSTASEGLEVSRIALLPGSSDIAFVVPHSRRDTFAQLDILEDHDEMRKHLGIYLVERKIRRQVIVPLEHLSQRFTGSGNFGALDWRRIALGARIRAFLRQHLGKDLVEDGPYVQLLVVELS